MIVAWIINRMNFIKHGKFHLKQGIVVKGCLAACMKLFRLVKADHMAGANAHRDGGVCHNRGVRALVAVVKEGMLVDMKNIKLIFKVPFPFDGRSYVFRIQVQLLY